MAQPSFFEGAAKLFTSIPLMSWKLWAVWTVLRSRAPFMYDELVQESFNFYGKTLSGTQQIRERWKRGVGAVEKALGEESGQGVRGCTLPAFAQGEDAGSGRQPPGGVPRVY